MPDKAQNPVKIANAPLTARDDPMPAKVAVDDSIRLKAIRRLVRENNRSSLDEDLIICQIYMESRFDSLAGAGHDARGLMQMQENAVKQVYKYRLHKKLRHMPRDSEAQQAFREGSAYHASDEIFDDAKNIQIGTEYMQYWIDTSPSIEDAYKRYRGKANGIYYRKINACAAKLKAVPDSMRPLREMIK